ncbi:hypothetical protein [Nocardia sp. NPDC050175]|uniref:hypothetical protein n=1 Tax=Nocardia sp. NPDC050175 TaxID=3364317 RepID=UPI0037AF9DCD
MRPEHTGRQRKPDDDVRITMGIFRKNTTKADEQPTDTTDLNATDAKKDRKRRRLLGGYYGGNAGT